MQLKIVCFSASFNSCYIMLNYFWKKEKKMLTITYKILHYLHVLH